MRRVWVRSRFGNLLLALYGAAYIIGTLYVLVWYVVDVGNAAAFADRLMQLILILGIACGVWFIRIALSNLGIWRGGFAPLSAARIWPRAQRAATMASGELPRHSAK